MRWAGWSEGWRATRMRKRKRLHECDCNYFLELFNILVKNWSFFQKRRQARSTIARQELPGSMPKKNEVPTGTPEATMAGLCHTTRGAVFCFTASTPRKAACLQSPRNCYHVFGPTSAALPGQIT